MQIIIESCDQKYIVATVIDPIHLQLQMRMGNHAEEDNMVYQLSWEEEDDKIMIKTDKDEFVTDDKMVLSFMKKYIQHHGLWIDGLYKITLDKVEKKFNEYYYYLPMNYWKHIFQKKDYFVSTHPIYHPTWESDYSDWKLSIIKSDRTSFCKYSNNYHDLYQFYNVSVQYEMGDLKIRFHIDPKTLKSRYVYFYYNIPNKDDDHALNVNFYLSEIEFYIEPTLINFDVIKETRDIYSVNMDQLTNSKSEELLQIFLDNVPKELYTQPLPKKYLSRILRSK